MSSPDDDPLPASLAAAWGLREPARRGPPRGLSLEAIVAAGVTIAEREGLGAVSMGRVAKAVGTSPMSLYRYVAAKSELLALMIDAAGGLPPERPPGEDWRDGLARWARGYIGVLRRHPWMIRVPIEGPPITPRQVAWLEDGLRSMTGTGLREEEKLSCLLLVSGFVRNDATLMADMGGADEPLGIMPRYGLLLRRLTDPERFPAIHAALGSVAFRQDDDLDAEFEFGLERVLDGIGVLVRRRGLPVPPD